MRDRLAPFNVRRPTGRHWWVFCRPTGRCFGPFETQSVAIDFAYKNWPWWP